MDNFPIVSHKFSLFLRHVAQNHQMLFSLDADSENTLARRFVNAGQRHSSGYRLHLGCRHLPLFLLVSCVLGSLPTLQFVIQDSVLLDMQGIFLALDQCSFKVESNSFFFFIKVRGIYCNDSANC